MAPEPRQDPNWPALALVLLLMLALIAIAWGAGHPGSLSGAPASGAATPAPASQRFGVPGLSSPRATPASPSAPPSPGRAEPAPDPSGPSGPAGPDPSTEPGHGNRAGAKRATLPGGRTRIFGHHTNLVAYYGTAETGALGVLGETRPGLMNRRVNHAAKEFEGRRRPVQTVYELIVTIADRSPGKDGDYSHDISRAAVQRYIDSAHRNGALLLLDLQPGRSDFLKVARRWRWALEDPWVGLALDPEWRMGRAGVPGSRIGSVTADEVNRTSAWLRGLTRAEHLPEKLFVLHQFRTSMIHNISRVRSRSRLATVQHVDGFGTRSQKLDTFHAVARPKQFTMGFKLFYDEDVRRMGPRQVRAIRPDVRFISFQ